MKGLLLLLILVSSNSVAQKTYIFDHISVYNRAIIQPTEDYKRKIDTNQVKELEIIYLTKKDDNSYFARLSEKDALHYSLNLTDHNGTRLKMTISKNTFNESEVLKAPCKNVSKVTNLFKYQIKNYDFKTLSDTILQNTTYSSYKLISINPKRAKRKKLGTILYIIDKKTADHLPLLPSPTAYEEWKSKKNIPNGLYAEKLQLFYSGATWVKEKMISNHSIKKQIIIDSSCF